MATHTYGRKRPRTEAHASEQCNDDPSTDAWLSVFSSPAPTQTPVAGAFDGNKYTDVAHVRASHCDSVESFPEGVSEGAEPATPSSTLPSQSPSAITSPQCTSPVLDAAVNLMFASSTPAARPFPASAANSDKLCAGFSTPLPPAPSPLTQTAADVRWSTAGIASSASATSSKIGHKAIITSFFGTAASALHSVSAAARRQNNSGSLWGNNRAGGSSSSGIHPARGAGGGWSMSHGGAASAPSSLGYARSKLSAPPSGQASPSQSVADAAQATSAAGASECALGEHGNVLDCDDLQPAAGQQHQQAVQQVQAYLDLGQRNFDNVRCASCGMVYCPGLDSREHEKHCSKYKGMHIAFSGWKNEKVAGRLSQAKGNSAAAASGGGGRIVHVAPSDAVQHSSKVAEVDSMLLRELGPESAPGQGELRTAVAMSKHRRSGSTSSIPAAAADGTSDQGLSESGSSVGYDVSKAATDDSASVIASAQSKVSSRVHRFLYVSDGQVGGVVIVEPARVAFRLVPRGTADVAASEQVVATLPDASAALGTDLSAPSAAVSADAAEDGVLPSAAASSAGPVACNSLKPSTSQPDLTGANGVGTGTSTHDISSMVLSSTLVPVVLGVAQVWVHPSFRRRGVARALLDAARAHAVYAYVVPKHELAFSQPTSAGYQLAREYLGTDNVPVY